MQDLTEVTSKIALQIVEKVIASNQKLTNSQEGYHI